MQTEQPIAAFADQITPGMRVSSAYKTGLWVESITVTQVRHTEGMVHVLGLHDDGAPFHYTAGPQLAVLIYDAPLVSR